MNTQEIKEAIEFAKGLAIPEYEERIKPLVDLAQRYLSASDVMPEKKEVMPGLLVTNYYFDGYNKAIDDCTLALTKKCEGLQELINREMLPEEGKKWEWAKQLSSAIQQYLLGKGEE